MLHTALWGSGHQIATISQIYVLLQLTESEFQLAILGGATAIGTTTTALIGGALADRFSRKTLLLFGSGITGCTALILGTLLITDTAQPWHLQLGGFIQGSSLALDWTARFAIIPNMVPRRILVRSLSIDLATFNLTRVFAPLVWGVLVAQIDFKAPYFFIAAFLAVNFIVITRFKPAADATEHTHGGFKSELADIPRILTSDPRVFGTMMFTLITALALGGFTYLLTPFGQNVLGASAQGISALFSAVGIGSFIGSLALGTLGAPKRIGWTMIAAVIFMAIYAIAFSWTLALIVAVLLACAFAVSHSTHVGLGYIILQLSTSDETRGRIAGLYELAWSGFPIGGLLFPAIAGLTSEQSAIIVVAIMLVIATCIMAVANPTLRRFQLTRR